MTGNKMLSLVFNLLTRRFVFDIHTHSMETDPSAPFEIVRAMLASALFSRTFFLLLQMQCNRFHRVLQKTLYASGDVRVPLGKKGLRRDSFRHFANVLHWDAPFFSGRRDRMSSPCCTQIQTKLLFITARKAAAQIPCPPSMQTGGNIAGYVPGNCPAGKACHSGRRCASWRSVVQP